jgi:hypothetical protein
MINLNSNGFKNQRNSFKKQGASKRESASKRDTKAEEKMIKDSYQSPEKSVQGNKEDSTNKKLMSQFSQVNIS